MKKLLFVLVIAAFASCGNSGSEAAADSTSVTMDTAYNGMNTDTTGVGGMNADTTGMGAAR